MIRFQTRLLITLLPLLLGLQCLTLAVVYERTRQHITEQSRSALTATRGNFERWLNETTARLADSSRVLASDFGLRGAIATEDRPTMRSALANAAMRIGAGRMMVIGPDGVVVADPAVPESEGSAFADTALLVQARDQGTAQSVLVIGNDLLEFVAVPVMAPDLIGWIGLGVAIDNAAAARLVSQSTIPIDLTFAVHEPERNWRTVASTLYTSRLDALLSQWTALKDRAGNELATVKLDDEDYASLLVQLTPADAAVPAYAAIQYSLHAALAPHRPLFIFLVGTMVVGFIGAGAAILLFARSITRPIRELDSAARRIQTGEYHGTLELSGAVEFNHLADTFNGMVADIAAREKRIEHQANFDQWTGLPNRASFERELSRCIARAQADGDDERLLVIIVRLENFIEINNTLGHAAGDQLIADAARRIQNCLKQGDRIGRLLQEKFAILLRNANDRMIEAVATRITLAFESEFNVAGVNVDVPIRIGIAIYPEHATDTRQLLRNAEVALRNAQSSIAAFSLYQKQQDPYTSDRLSLMSDLRSCMEQDQLELHYQPKVDLPGGEIRQVEALVRWRHPERGNVPPDMFIGIAETTGHIRRLTRWVITRAIADSCEWRAAGHMIRVSVNVSAKDLVDPTLPTFIMQELTRHDMKPEMLVLEITESAVMDSPELSLNLLRSLNAMGLRIALDDFGTGHSSMAYVKQLPATELKIDKSFVLELASSPTDQIIVQAVVDLAHNLGMKVTAEGVEDVASVQLLARLGCDYAQGWHFGRPVPAPDLLARLQQTTTTGHDAKVRPIR
ncbi:MAG: EAL domain-containing protein [Gammaproteobacteria bacterium]|nr:EAL domain-containing protein [Gammaproteobacteria bacterium]